MQQPDPELDNLLTTGNKKEEKSELDVLKDLFIQKDIESKTELTAAQVVLINQKRTIAKMLNWESLNNCLDDLMLLLISHRRRGRSEFVDAFKSNREHAEKTQGGLFNRIGDMLK